MGPGVWIGLNDCLFPKTHTWYWGFGKKQCKWFDWFGKEPLFDGNNKNCVSLWEHYHYCWKLDNCRSKLYYVCEMARVSVYLVVPLMLHVTVKYVIEYRIASG